MRILMYSTYFPPQYSGAAKQALSLAKHLRERGHHVEFVTVRWPGLTEHDEVEGFAVHRVEMGRGEKHKEFRLWWNLFRLVVGRRRDFDVIHSHGAYYTNSIVGMLAKLVGWKSLVKASLTENDLHGIGRSFTGRVHYWLLRSVDAYVAISKELESEFLKTGLPKGKVVCLPNGVDTERFQPSTPEEKKRLRATLGIPADRPVALAVGVFDQRKNIGWLMEEWGRHHAFGTCAVLLAIGPQSREDAGGVFLESLRNLAAEKGDILRLMDHVDDIESYYRAADLFILPSHSEGMPNVVLEAMASGLPCVATRVSGIEELVQEGKTGFTFGIGDPAGLQDAVVNALHDSEGAVGRRARQNAEEHYALKVLAARYEELYGNLVHNRPEGVNISFGVGKKQTHA
jgi:glycosyltransferase involved in cell wall biosynthesis